MKSAWIAKPKSARSARERGSSQTSSRTPTYLARASKYRLRAAGQNPRLWSTTRVPLARWKVASWPNVGHLDAAARVKVNTRWHWRAPGGMGSSTSGGAVSPNPDELLICERRLQVATKARSSSVGGETSAGLAGAACVFWWTCTPPRSEWVPRLLSLPAVLSLLPLLWQPGTESLAQQRSSCLQACDWAHFQLQLISRRSVHPQPRSAELDHPSRQDCHHQPAASLVHSGLDTHPSPRPARPTAHE
mmetsp:Transcript_39851/g.124306  ORF Transcript_39851/g.124306 Transcript_39851/m.124306 type:complete len:247 (+) Transcript_39851:729-1469(+)